MASTDQVPSSLRTGGPAAGRRRTTWSRPVPVHPAHERAIGPARPWSTDRAPSPGRGTPPPGPPGARRRPVIAHPPGGKPVGHPPPGPVVDEEQAAVPAPPGLAHRRVPAAGHPAMVLEPDGRRPTPRAAPPRPRTGPRAWTGGPRSPRPASGRPATDAGRPRSPARVDQRPTEARSRVPVATGQRPPVGGRCAPRRWRSSTEISHAPSGSPARRRSGARRPLGRPAGGGQAARPAVGPAAPDLATRYHCWSAWST